MTADYSSEYPYFIYPAVMALRRGVEDPAEEMRLRRIVAANVGDIPALRLMLGIDPEDFANFYPDIAAPTLSTNETISSFLSHFGREETPIPPAAANIPEAPKEASPEEAPKETPEETPEEIQKKAPEEAPKLPPTEQNARLLIKNRDYQGALEIIQQLSLNIPEKSVYFADQIRFLKKLIINEARKNM